VCVCVCVCVCVYVCAVVCMDGSGWRGGWAGLGWAGSGDPEQARIDWRQIRKMDFKNVEDRRERRGIGVK